MNNLNRQFQDEKRYRGAIIAYVFFFILISSLIFSIATIPLASLASLPQAYNYIAIHYSTMHNLFLYICVFVLIGYICLNPLIDDYKKCKKNIGVFLTLSLVTVFAIYFGNIISSVINEILNIKGDSENQESIVIMTKQYFPIMLLTAGLLGPVVEELVFRKAIFGLCQKDNVGLIVSSVTFGLIHVISAGDFIQIFPYLISGIVLGLMYIQSKRNVFVTITAHMITNLISLILIQFM